MKRELPIRPPELTETEQKILELLVTGASSKAIAAQLGYKDGTTRVYLHALYKRIGVSNKTSAVTWYLDLQRAGSVDSSKPASAETFGDRAIQSDLYSSLGMMEVFLGPYGKMWDMLTSLEGDGDRAQELRCRSRQLWNAFVRGDFREAARYYDREGSAKLFVESPSDSVVLAASLLLGGYTARATKVTASLKLKRDGSIGITPDEKAALAAIGDFVEEIDADVALGALHRLADRGLRRPVFRHFLIVALFHAYCFRNDVARARDVANVVWAEAEAARVHLRSMGDMTFPAGPQLPPPPKLTRVELARYLAKPAS
jgi:DNA-binding CsgD family transcriptional regulator